MKQSKAIQARIHWGLHRYCRVNNGICSGDKRVAFFFTALRGEMPEMINIATGREARAPALDKFAAAFSEKQQ
jgi:hypothetical protein